MKSIFRFCVYIIGLTLVTRPIWAQDQNIIFDPKVQCTAYTPGWYQNCSSIPRDGVDIRFAPEGVSLTSNAFVGAQLFKSIITYQYNCSKANRIDNAYLRIGSIDSLMRADGSGVIETTIIYNTNDQYQLIRTARSFTTIPETCRIEITSNVTVPYITPFIWYISRLRSDAHAYLKIHKALKDAAILPAKVAIITTLPDRIQGQIDMLDNELSGAKDELAVLTNISPDLLSATDKQRLADLQGDGGVIANLQLMVKNLHTIQQDARDMLSDNVGEKCKTSIDKETNAICLARIEKIADGLDANYQTLANEIKSIQDFFQAEKQRLESVDKKTSQQIDLILDLINKE